VEGILGPNAFKNFRVQIDYAGGALFLEKVSTADAHDMDIVGLTLRPGEDGSYQVIGVARKGERPAVEGVTAGDTLLQVDELKVMGATMGSVVDALRGKPGDLRTLVLERGGKRMRVQARVDRFL
jgi:C-terminal processing protease CtpA/Prc